MAHGLQNGVLTADNLKHKQDTNKFSNSPVATHASSPQLSSEHLDIHTSQSSTSGMTSVTQELSHLTINSPLQTNYYLSTPGTDNEFSDQSLNNACTGVKALENHLCDDQNNDGKTNKQQQYSPINMVKTKQSGNFDMPIEGMKSNINKNQQSVGGNSLQDQFKPAYDVLYTSQNPHSYSFPLINTTTTQSNSSDNLTAANQRTYTNVWRQISCESYMPKAMDSNAQPVSILTNIQCKRTNYATQSNQSAIDQSTALSGQQSSQTTYNLSQPFLSYQVPDTVQKATDNQIQSKQYPINSRYSNLNIPEPVQQKAYPFKPKPNTSRNQQQPCNQQEMINQEHSINSYQGILPQPNYPGYHPTVTSLGFNKLWGNENYDLLQSSDILPHSKIQPPKTHLGQEMLENVNCSPDIFRCTLTKIPETNTLLQKSRLPLGILIHPFKDLSYLAVIQCNIIVRCRACRTYINPFVYFVDNKRWKCNLCYRINELPEEFQYDPVSKTYGDPSRRPEVRSSTIEYIAPAEYMLRPPQPAVYLFLLDVSRPAIESGYLHTVCLTLLEEIKNLPGDARTQIGFLAYDSYLHFFSLGEGLNQPHEMTVLEIDDVFLPCPDNLLVNLKDRMEMVVDLLKQLPTRYINSFDNNSALGAALQIAHKMMSPSGGRVTVFQSSLPNVGPGALFHRETLDQRSSLDSALINPANDFYKRLSLDCSAQQIAVDLFVINSQFVDLATISGISRFSGGCIYHFPLFNINKNVLNDSFQRGFRRYLTRKIGFEAVMRIRCSRGISIHTFHGNFFVRSTDLLSLPNVNPDAGYGMQISIDENLSELQTICFQAALLYTSSRGERRIRVHTLCLPVTSMLHEVINSADQQCIIGILTKMAVDRSMQSSLSDAREAFINVAVDILSSYKMSLNLGNGSSGLLVPECLKLLPLYISALLKFTAFRLATTRLDDRVKAMLDMKTKPLCLLMQQLYPDLYPVHNLEEYEVMMNSDEQLIPQPPHLQLTARCLEHTGAFLMDTGEHMFIYVCSGISEVFLIQGLGVASFDDMDDLCEIPVLENPVNKRLHLFMNNLNDEKPFIASLQIIKDNSANRFLFLEKLIEDRQENALSYHEFLQHLRSQMK